MRTIRFSALRFTALAPGLVLAGALIAGSAFAQTAGPPAAADAAPPEDQPDFSVLIDPPADIPIRAPIRARPATPRAPGAAQPTTVGSRDERVDGSVAVSAGEQLPTPWEAKVGVDVGLAAPPPLPNTLASGAQDHGAGWANLAVPAAPIGLDKATIDARVDPDADQGKLSTSLSRSMPVGGGVSLTLQNAYSVTQTLANPGGPAAAPSAHVFSGDGALRVELPTATAFSAGATMSSMDDKLLPSVSAEQKLFGTPLSLSGSISARPTGDTDKSIKAGFKRTW
jgi:hypothetical protein